jgi:hypothetical protein
VRFGYHHQQHSTLFLTTVGRGAVDHRSTADSENRKIQEVVGSPNNNKNQNSKLCSPTRRRGDIDR